MRLTRSEGKLEVSIAPQGLALGFAGLGFFLIVFATLLSPHLWLVIGFASAGTLIVAAAMASVREDRFIFDIERRELRYRCGSKEWERVPFDAVRAVERRRVENEVSTLEHIFLVLDGSEIFVNQLGQESADPGAAERLEQEIQSALGPRAS